MSEREPKIAQPKPIILENPTLREAKQVVYHHALRPGSRISCVWYKNNSIVKTSAAIPYQMTEKGLYLFLVKEASRANRLIVDKLSPQPLKEVTLTNLSDEEIRRITEFQAKKPKSRITYVWENEGVAASLTISPGDYRYKNPNWKKHDELFRTIKGANKIIIRDSSPIPYPP